jgi:exonuclease III
MSKNSKNTFKICTFNCNGIADLKKRKDIFDVLRKLDCNIYFLQETHVTSLQEDFFQNAWGFKAWTCGIETNKNGVAILFNNNFDFKVLDIIKDPGGCYIAMNVKMLNKTVTLINIYGPSSGDDPAFFDNISICVEKFGNDHIIAAGDWNCVLNRAIDERNYTSATNRPNTRKKLLDMMTDLDLTDIFRELYPDKRAYTWRRFKSIKQARLDYFLISKELGNDIKQVDIEAAYRSDHSPVILSIKKEEFKKDKPFWKFNNSLLRDKKYIDEIKILINNIKKQYAVPVYNFDNINEIANKDIAFIINDQLFFETLLMEIRGKTIAYSSYKKSLEREREKIVGTRISYLQSNLQQSNVEELESLQNELQEIRKKRIDGIIVRSRAQWLTQGEKVTRYFCHLESRNFINKTMNFLEKDGGIISDQKLILEEVNNFYKDLYSYKEVEVVDLDQALPNTTRLSLDESNQLEGLITLDEITCAIKTMNNNKSPGIDGFSAEFFKFFFVDISAFLLRSVNEAFVRGEMSVNQKRGIITCIPKEGKNKRFIKNWRPITLLNISYKIASACIAKRLKQVLPTLINECQRGFLKGRNMNDNTRLLYDTLVYTEKNNIPGMLLLIDFEKAFDSISWTFLQNCLDFLKFGPDIKRWISTLYKDASTCVTVNGQYSQWFPILRGVRQGDPLSPYLYLIGAEILSLMIRNNNIIKGIKMKERENLLAQFADDTTMYLDGSEESFREAVNILRKFTKISGLKMNVEKTQVVGIGSLKGIDIHYMRDQNYVWNPGTFKVLGIIFSTDLHAIVRLNFDDKLLTLRKILSSWKKRHLTPYGRIVVLKSLVISRITHLFINLPDPAPDFLSELNNMCFTFLWEDKPSKINKKVACNTYENGGLKMIDIYSFLTTMKVTWLRKLKENSDWKEFTCALYPSLIDIENLGCEYAQTAMHKVDNIFWKDVLKHYKKLYSKCQPRNIHEFLSECIHYNSNITRGHKIIQLKEWINAGVLLIRHLLDENGNFMTFTKFQGCFPTINLTNFLQYAGIINAIKQYQNKLNFECTSKYKILKTKVWYVIKRGNKSVINKLVSSEIVPTAVAKWNLECENFDWRKAFSCCYSTTKDVQIRWFQVRLLHRLLPTQKKLYTLKIADSPNCNICNMDLVQTIEHLFWDCDAIQLFWNEFICTLKQKCGHCSQMCLSKNIVLFGFGENVITDVIFDYLILIAKFYIYKCKMQSTIPTISGFLRYAYVRYTTDYYASMIAMNNRKFCEQWAIYRPLLVNNST